MPAEVGETNGKVTLRDLYEKNEKLYQAIIDSERRIMSEIKHLNENGSPTARQALAEACEVREDVDKLDERMDDFVLKYNVWNGLNSALVVIAGWLGFKQ